MNIIFDIIGYWTSITLVTLFIGFWILPLAATLLSIYYCSVMERWEDEDEGDWGIARLTPNREDYEGKSHRLLFQKLRWDWTATKLGGIMSFAMFAVYSLVTYKEDLSFVGIIHRFGEWSSGGFSYAIILILLWTLLVKGGKILVKIQDTLSTLDGGGSKK